jgi:signal transduction histidine kinase
VNAPTRLYVASVVVAGAVLALATMLMAWPPLTVELLASMLILFVLALATELISVPLPREGDLVASTIVHIVAIFILPLPLAVLMAGGSVLVGQLLVRRRWSRVVFNVGQTILSVGLPALLVHVLSRDGALLTPGRGWADLPAVLLVLVVHYVLNSLFVNVVVALSESMSPVVVWRENNAVVLLPDFGMGAVGVLIAYVWRTDPVWSFLTLIPAVITIVSFRQIRRIEEESARNARLLAEAEATLRSRDEFLSVAAHELKTPLTSLLGFAELLLRQLDRNGGVDPALAGRALQSFREQTTRMAGLVEQLLWFSRLEAGHLTITPRPTDLVGLVEGAVAAARARAGARVINVSAPPALPAQVDAPRIEQVLNNLLDNAIKYSPDGTVVDVTVGDGGPGEARLAVRDHGRGVPPEHRPHLFDRSHRAPTVQHVSGLGIGLHISRQIVELHGGKLGAEFPEDGGTCFVLLLPTAAG